MDEDAIDKFGRLSIYALVFAFAMLVLAAAIDAMKHGL